MYHMKFYFKYLMFFLEVEFLEIFNLQSLLETTNSFYIFLLNNFCSFFKFPKVVML